MLSAVKDNSNSSRTKEDRREAREKQRPVRRNKRVVLCLIIHVAE